MKTLFNNLFRKILACALMAMVSMPTSAFSASDSAFSSMREDVKKRGLWLECNKNLKRRHEQGRDTDPKIINTVRNSAAQCKMLDGDIPLAKKMLKESVDAGSISAKYLLIEIQFYEEQSINEQEFMNLLKIIKTPMKEGGEIIGIDWPHEEYPRDTYYLTQELGNKITIGLMQLLTRLQIEINKLPKGSQERKASTAIYWNLVDEVGGESGCKKLLELVLTRAQELIHKRENFLRKEIDDYTDAANIIKEKECPNFYDETSDGLGFRYSK